MDTKGFAFIPLGSVRELSNMDFLLFPIGYIYVSKRRRGSTDSDYVKVWKRLQRTRRRVSSLELRKSRRFCLNIFGSYLPYPLLACALESIFISQNIPMYISSIAGSQ